MNWREPLSEKQLQRQLKYGVYNAMLIEAVPYVLGLTVFVLIVNWIW